MSYLGARSAAGYWWLETHFAHGYLGVSFFSSLGNQRTDRYEGSAADRVIREELIDLVMLGRAVLANPHWPVWAARELNHPSPFSLVPDDWRWWLENFRGHGPSIGWPEVAAAGTSSG